MNSYNTNNTSKIVFKWRWIWNWTRNNLKSTFSKEIPKNIDLTIVGSKKHLLNTYKHLKSLGLKNIANPRNLKIHDLEISSSENKSKSSYGFKFLLLNKSHWNCKTTSQFSASNGPICKKSWSLAGHYFSGQTEVLAKSCGVKNVGMLFTAKSPITGWRFNTLLATTHIALCMFPRN